MIELFGIRSSIILPTAIMDRGMANVAAIRIHPAVKEVNKNIMLCLIEFHEN